MSTTFQMRIDKKIKSRAQQVFKKAGLDLSSGTRLLLTRVAQSGQFLPGNEFKALNSLSTKELTLGYRQNLRTNLRIAKEWQPLEEELWAREVH